MKKLIEWHSGGRVYYYIELAWKDGRIVDTLWNLNKDKARRLSYNQYDLEGLLDTIRDLHKGSDEMDLRVVDCDGDTSYDAYDRAMSIIR